MSWTGKKTQLAWMVFNTGSDDDEAVEEVCLDKQKLPRAHRPFLYILELSSDIPAKWLSPMAGLDKKRFFFRNPSIIDLGPTGHEGLRPFPALVPPSHRWKVDFGPS